MSSSIRLAGGLCLAGAVMLLVGCGGKEQEQPALSPAAAERRAETLRESYQRVNPNVRVGTVTAVRQQDRLAAVSEIDTTGLSRGSVVVFIDANSNALVTGQVVETGENTISVRYEQPPTGRRIPQAGDLVVHVPRR